MPGKRELVIRVRMDDERSRRGFERMERTARRLERLLPESLERGFGRAMRRLERFAQAFERLWGGRMVQRLVRAGERLGKALVRGLSRVRIIFPRRLQCGHRAPFLCGLISSQSSLYQL